MGVLACVALLSTAFMVLMIAAVVVSSNGCGITSSRGLPPMGCSVGTLYATTEIARVNRTVDGRVVLQYCTGAVGAPLPLPPPPAPNQTDAAAFVPCYGGVTVTCVFDAPPPPRLTVVVAKANNECVVDAGALQALDDVAHTAAIVIVAGVSCGGVAVGVVLLSYVVMWLHVSCA